MIRSLAALRSRTFLWLWLGQTVSTIGDRMVFIALALYVTQRTGSPEQVGVVLAANALPMVLFLLLGGVWADRLPRHQIMIATDVARFALHAVLAALIFTGGASLLAIVIIEALFGSAEAFFRPAYTALVPQTVPEELIQAASALSQTTANAAQFLGPALATALVAGPGAGWAFAVDSGTFLVSAGFLLMVRPRARGESAARSTILRELVEGFREVRSRAWVWVTISVFTGALLTGLAPIFTLGATVAEHEYGSVSVFGVMEAVMGAGTLVGALVGVRWRARRPMVFGFLAMLPWPITIAAFALGFPRGVVYAMAAVEGAGFALFLVWWETALAQRIPPAALARVTAWDWMGSLALVPLGYVAAGVVATAVGAQTVLLAGAGISAALMLVGLIPRETRELRELEPTPAYSGVT